MCSVAVTIGILGFNEYKDKGSGGSHTLQPSQKVPPHVARPPKSSCRKVNGTGLLSDENLARGQYKCLPKELRFVTMEKVRHKDEPVSTT